MQGIFQISEKVLLTDPSWSIEIAPILACVNGQ